MAHKRKSGNLEPCLLGHKGTFHHTFAAIWPEDRNRAITIAHRNDPQFAGRQWPSSSACAGEPAHRIEFRCATLAIPALAPPEPPAAAVSTSSMKLADSSRRAALR